MHPAEPQTTPALAASEARGTDDPAAAVRRARPLRVLLVAPWLPLVGGQVVQANRLLSYWNNDPAITAVLQPVNPQLPGALRRLQSVKYLRTLITSALYWIELLVQVPRYDLVHIFSASYLSFLLGPTPALLVAKLYGRKSILNYRSGEAEHHLRRWRHTALPIIRLADAIVVPSDYLVGVFAQFGLRARAIFNVVEIDRFCFRERTPLRPIFLSNRHLEPMYNVGCVLRAFALIQARFPKANLIVAGDGSQRVELQLLVNQLKLRNVEFAGTIPPARMHELYARADIYLNGSEIDNMPGSILEAFAAGLPVVTTNAGGIPYIVSDGVSGLLVARGDHAGMAECAIRLLECPALAQHIQTTAREQCDGYSWTSLRSQWLQFYGAVAEGNSSRVTITASGATENS